MVIILDSVTKAERLCELLHNSAYATNRPVFAMDYMRFAKPLMYTERAMENQPYLMQGAIGDIYKQNVANSDYGKFIAVKNTMNQMNKNDESYLNKFTQWFLEVYRQYSDNEDAKKGLYLIYNCSLVSDNNGLSKKIAHSTGIKIKHLWVDDIDTSIMNEITNIETMERFVDKREDTIVIGKEILIDVEKARSVQAVRYEPITVEQWLSYIDRDNKPSNVNLHNMLIEIWNNDLSSFYYPVVAKDK